MAKVVRTFRYIENALEFFTHIAVQVQALSREQIRLYTLFSENWRTRGVLRHTILEKTDSFFYSIIKNTYDPRSPGDLGQASNGIFFYFQNIQVRSTRSGQLDYLQYF